MLELLSGRSEDWLMPTSIRRITRTITVPVRRVTVTRTITIKPVKR